ncbi:hypothetical protein AB5I41_03265 [Sphingomonas sp. MMS24-JH45]
MLGLVGVPHDAEASFPVNISELMSYGHRIVGILEGDSDQQGFIPELIAHQAAGRFPFDKLIRTSPVRDQRGDRGAGARRVREGGAGPRHAFSVNCRSPRFTARWRPSRSRNLPMNDMANSPTPGAAEPLSVLAEYGLKDNHLNESEIEWISATSAENSFWSRPASTCRSAASGRCCG